MTSWEIEKLTKNILMFDNELKTESNVYAVLHQIAKSDDAEMDLYYDYLLNHIDDVLDAYFDDVLLGDDERVIVIKEVLLCIKKFEGLPLLSELINNLEETFEQFMVGYEVDTPDEDHIANQLQKMENEL